MCQDPSVSENCSSCGCETRAHFEESIDNTWDLPSENKRQASKEGPKYPTEGYNEHSFFGVNMVIFWFKERANTTKEEKYPHRPQNTSKHLSILMVNKGNDKWYN